MDELIEKPKRAFKINELDVLSTQHEHPQSMYTNPIECDCLPAKCPGPLYSLKEIAGRSIGTGLARKIDRIRSEHVLPWEDPAIQRLRDDLSMWHPILRNLVYEASTILRTHTNKNMLEALDFIGTSDQFSFWYILHSDTNLRSITHPSRSDRVELLFLYYLSSHRVQTESLTISIRPENFHKFISYQMFCQIMENVSSHLIVLHLQYPYFLSSIFFPIFLHARSLTKLHISWGDMDYNYVQPVYVHALLSNIPRNITVLPEWFLYHGRTDHICRNMQRTLPWSKTPLTCDMEEEDCVWMAQTLFNSPVFKAIKILKAQLGGQCVTRWKRANVIAPHVKRIYLMERINQILLDEDRFKDPDMDDVYSIFPNLELCKVKDILDPREQYHMDVEQFVFI